MKLNEALLAIKEGIPYIEKDASGYNYKYVKGSNLLAKLNPLFLKHGVTVIVHIEGEKMEMVQIKDKKGTEKTKFFVTLNLFYRFAMGDESISLPWVGYGLNEDPSMASGSALTYAERYFFLKQFQVPTDEDDPDKWEEKNTPADEVDDKKRKKARAAIHKVLRPCTSIESLNEASRKWSREWGFPWESLTTHNEVETFKSAAQEHKERILKSIEIEENREIAEAELDDGFDRNIQ